MDLARGLFEGQLRSTLNYMDRTIDSNKDFMHLSEVYVFFFFFAFNSNIALKKSLDIFTQTILGPLLFSLWLQYFSKKKKNLCICRTIDIDFLYSFSA